MTSEFVKLLLIGDSGVGKSCILKRYTDNKFTNGFYNTIGVQFSTKVIDINGKKCKLQIWDTAGQQRFRAITSNYYKGANGILIVFDLTDKQSFKNVQYWIEQVEKNGNQNSVKILVGNKCDLVQKRVILEEQAIKLASTHKIQYIQSSALNSSNINLVFQTIAKRALREKKDRLSRSQLNTDAQNKAPSWNTKQKFQIRYSQTKQKIKSSCC